LTKTPGCSTEIGLTPIPGSTDAMRLEITTTRGPATDLGYTRGGPGAASEERGGCSRGSGTVQGCRRGECQETDQPQAVQTGPGKDARRFFSDWLRAASAISGVRKSAYSISPSSRAWIPSGASRPVQPAEAGHIVEFPEVNGLHHHYERCAA
jgi:hypothetical protein